MKKFDFLAGSLVVHAAIIVAALLLPPPFPSGTKNKERDLTYVELRHAGGRNTAARHLKPQPGRHAKGEKPLPASVPDNSALAPVGVPPKPRPQEPEAPANKAVPQAARRTEEKRAQTPAHVPAKASAKTRAPEPPPPQFAPVPPEAQAVTVSEEAPVVKGIEADKTSINFKYQKGWPVPAMVRFKVEPVGGRGGAGLAFKAVPDSNWIIVSPVSGSAPDIVKVGVDTSRLSLGYHEGVVIVNPAKPGLPGVQVAVSVMVLPKTPGVPELPHSAWDPYMRGDCKVCHLPKQVMPSGNFMYQPEFCGLCHNPSGTAKDKAIAGGGHPVLVEAGSGGTKMPTVGNVRSGAKSDRMADHLKDGKLVVCVTCHNVMEKPGDYGRTWEITSSKDRRRYYLLKGGWENMGYMQPKVYVTAGLMTMPQYLSELKRYEAGPGQYRYDESEGVIEFDRPRGRDETVYVTLDNPYLRVTTEDNRLCFDCHYENTHAGLNCLACHIMHGTSNIKCIRASIRTPDKAERRVVFRARDGKNSFADGDASRDGICDACHSAHLRHKDGHDYAGSDCTRCHTHKNGFEI